MKNINFKNKIAIITIMLLAVFSFSNKVSAAVGITMVNATDTSAVLKATGLATGPNDLYLLLVQNDPSNTTVFEHSTPNFKADTGTTTKTLSEITGLTPVSKYVAKLKKLQIVNNVNSYTDVASYSFTTRETLDPYTCNLYLGDKNNPLSAPPLMSAAQYWFLPPPASTYFSNPSVWQGAFSTLAECNTKLKAATPVAVSSSGGAVNSDTNYTLLAQLPDGSGGTLTSYESGKASAFGDYFNIIIRLFIGICAVLSMIMIVIGGIEYMTSELSGHKEEGKERITNAIFGLIIALGSYALLNTINPALLDVSLTGVKNAEVTINLSGSEYRLSQTQGSDTAFRRTGYYGAIKTSVGSAFPHCLLQVTIQRESAGKPFLVGHDEDAPSKGIPSRKTFVTSGKKFAGETFTPSDSLIEDHTFFNKDHIVGDIHTATDLTKDDLGLDWRFSHSLGLFGVTFYPNNYTSKITVPGVTGPVGIKEILNNTNNADLLRAKDLMSKAYAQSGNDVQKTYKIWASGDPNTKNAYAVKEATLRTNLYNQCVTQDN